MLHIGAGLGYCSAVMAHVVGPSRRVVAVEVNDGLAAAARSNVSTMPWIEVRCDGGIAIDRMAFDAILVNAGVTHPQETWIDALAPDGRLLVPLTVEIPGMGATLGKGVVAVIADQTTG